MKGRIFSIIVGLSLSLLLSACSGSGNSTSDNSDILDPDTPKTGNVRLVRQSDGVATDTISANQPGTVIAFVDNLTQQVVVDFSSTIGNLPVATALTDDNGEAQVELLAGETLGAGYVTASVAGEDVGTVAFNIVPIGETSPDLQVPTSIVFVDANPSTIQLAGTGGVEQSTVTFKVVDDFGQPVEGQSVQFSLLNTAGGVGLQIASAVSNSVGEVSTVVNSGTVATTVRVEAELTSISPSVAAVSSLLTISTGIPDQNSMSLSVSTLNMEAWETDGVVTTVTARLADHFNNPVPDGTAVQFRTEGGSIQPSCTTLNGVCSVELTSQDPRPAGPQNSYQSTCFAADWANAAVLCAGKAAPQPAAGRVSILAFATGEESFADLNSNGLFDSTEEVTQFLAGDNVSNTPFDLGEAFVDFNEDGLFNPAQAGGDDGGVQEEFVDFDGNGQWDGPDLLYNGSLCGANNAAACGDANDSTAVSTNVREQGVVIFASSTAYFTFPDLASSTIDVSSGDPETLSFYISDINGQQMPVGSTVTIEGVDCKVTGVLEITWPNSNGNGGRGFAVTVAADTTPTGGQVIITVTTPGEVASFRAITVVE